MRKEVSIVRLVVDVTFLLVHCVAASDTTSLATFEFLLEEQMKLVFKFPLKTRPESKNLRS